MERASNKSERLTQLEQLLIANPQGLKKAEIARRLGVNRSTIGRYIDELSGRHDSPIPIFDDGGVIKINRDKYLNYIGLTVHEAMAVHLATRLMATRTDKHNRHAAAALRKLGQSLETFAPLISQTVTASANTIDDAARRQDENYMRTLEILTRAWSDRQMVRVWHRYKDGGQVYKYQFAPYFIEPYAVGQTTHVIGLRIPPTALRTFKLERIERIELLNKPYTIPVDFNAQTRLADAWGIWYTENEPVEVVLKFQRNVAGRVKETQWHTSETITSQPDSSIIWRAKIAEPREMLPWIRGWGANCEVVAPEPLRDEIKNHVWKQSQTYNLTTQAVDLDSRLLRLWGKTTKDAQHFHPALFHMFDVAHVAQQLLSSRTSNRWRRVLANVLNAEAATLHEWLPYLIALHDLGKISVPFQVLNTEQHDRLKEEGFSFGKATQNDGRKLHHTIVGRIVLKDVAAGWPNNLSAAFIEMVSGHHGIFQGDERKDRRNFNRLKEAGEWPQLRQRAIQILQSYLLQQWPNPMPNPANQSAAMMALNGFCILCDWLGSDEDYFTPAPHDSVTEYTLKSRQQAYKRVCDANFFQRATSTAPTQFASLFADIDKPRPLQFAIDRIPDELLQHPTLTIIEAPTGEGKTEAALALARRIAVLHGTDEMYIALPTTATSNAMFERVQIHLQQRLQLPPELVKLVHGQDFLIEDDLRINPMDSIEPDGQTESPSLAWFAPKKKALLAPVGVGTIDQAELSALNVRHNALRMIGLAGKTVILDEVHAYDTYMTTIIKRMLTWLSALGSSVILLSATLPFARRKELAEAFAGNQADTIADFKAYPSLLTIGTAGHYPASPQAHQLNKTLALHMRPFIADNPAAKAAWLLEQVQRGGCACWMVNTVKRAQQIYNELLKTAPSDVSLDLLHARFPLVAREARESAIMKKYSKNGDRPAKGIVVGTQVLEQSLDLDFDVMMTDPAPIDLILQRAGRLHRHKRKAAVRYSHQEPHLYINTTVETADRKIYTDYILQKSEQTLGGRSVLTLPADYRPLIEAVYTEPTPDDPLYKIWDALDTEKIRLEDEAELRLMEEPEPDSPFYHSWKPQNFKEDEESRGWIVAQTRWGKRSITVIPLLREDETARAVSGEETAPLNQKAERDTQLKLLRHSLRVSHDNLVEYFKTSDETFKLFTDSPLLRNCVPLWLEPGKEDGLWINREVDVCLHPELGLVIGQL